MMKFLHVFIGGVLALLLLAAGLFITATALQGGEVWNHWLGAASGRRWEVLLSALALVLGVILYIITGFPFKQRVRYLAYDVDGNTVSVSLNAVNDVVTGLASEFAAILEMTPVLTVQGGVLQVQLDVVIKAGSQIPELSRMLQERTKEAIKDQVGVSELGPVKVCIQKIQVGSGSSNSAKETRSGASDYQP
jgi:uncharacterized alkaline shock family protein YloU